MRGMNKGKSFTSLGMNWVRDHSAARKDPPRLPYQPQVGLVGI
jgi:hypothetical protein